MNRFGRRLGALALLAMLVRAVVPDGYMLAEARSDLGRYLVVEMCDGHGGADQVIDLDTGKVVDVTDAPGKPDGNKTGAPCVFAVSAHMSAPPIAAEPVRFEQVSSAEVEIIPDLRPGCGIAAPPPPATGPPISI